MSKIYCNARTIQNFSTNGKNLVFGNEISIDFISIDNAESIHVVDTATRLSASTFLDKLGETYGQSVDGTKCMMVYFAYMLRESYSI